MSDSTGTPPTTTDDRPDAGPDDRPSGVLAGLAPQGPLQIVAAILAVCFLAGAIGYFVGSRPAATATLGDVDRGFLIDMSAHHDQAVSIAQCSVSKATDQVVQGFAAEVMVFQSREIGTMEAYLAARGLERPDDDTDRPAMTWMGMPTTAAHMPGMQADDDVQKLCVTSGKEVDHQFLTLMRAHHLGGIHMAEFAATNAESSHVRALADSMVKIQKSEAGEYTIALKRLGFE